MPRTGTRLSSGVRALALGALGSLALPLAATGQDVTEIVWRFADFPPNSFVTTSGRDGIGQALARNLHAKMPGVVARFTDGPIARSFGEAQAGVNLCMTFTLATPERRTFLVFATAQVVVATNRLFLKTAVRDRVPLATDGSADLAAALANGLRFGAVRERSYSSAVDPVVRSNPKAVHVVNTNRQVIEMFAADRIDLFIGLPHETEYFRRDAGIATDTWMSLPLPGPRVIEVPIAACTAGPWGEAAIRLIDAAYTADVVERYVLDYTGWIDRDTRDLVFGELDRRGIPHPPAERPEG